MWIARDVRPFTDLLSLWDTGSQPRLQDLGYGDEAYEFDTACWVKLTGMKLEPGYCQRIKITKTKTGFSVRRIGKPQKMEVV